MKLPTSEELHQVQQLEKLLATLSPERAFQLFQESTDKCPQSISQQLLMAENLQDKRHYEYGQPFALLVEKRLLEAFHLYLKLVQGYSKYKKSY